MEQSERQILLERLEQLTNPQPLLPLKLRNSSDMLLIIDAIRETDRYITDIFLKGGCYQFHLMLKKLAPICEPRINADCTHIVTFFDGKYFDITGIVEGEFFPLSYEEVEVASKWSFSKNMALQIDRCSFCDEPITV